MVKLVAESLSEHNAQDLNEGLFDSPRKLVDKAIANPNDEKMANDAILAMLAVYFGKPSSKGAKDIVLKYPIQQKIELLNRAKQLYADPKVNTLRLTPKDGKYVLGAMSTSKAIF